MKGEFGDSLAHLAMYASSDKRMGADAHGYVKYYDPLFAPFRNRPVKLFEIGVAKGRSQLMWTYYFPKGHIYGIDIDDQQHYIDCRETHLDRIHLEVMDQSDASALTEFARRNGPFDFVIDDGSHDPEHQIISFETLLPFTKHYYVIEDMHPGYSDGGHKTIEHFQTMIHEINRWGMVRAYDVQHAPAAQRIEWVQFVPNAIVVKLR
jgi:demethylmacrocin O-methyltransferase